MLPRNQYTSLKKMAFIAKKNVGGFILLHAALLIMVIHFTLLHCKNRVKASSASGCTHGVSGKTAFMCFPPWFWFAMPLTFLFWSPLCDPRPRPPILLLCAPLCNWLWSFCSPARCASNREWQCQVHCWVQKFECMLNLFPLVWQGRTSVGPLGRVILVTWCWMQACKWCHPRWVAN